MSEDKRLRPMPEQITYANLLFLGAWVGIFLSILTYFIYVTGILEPLIPMSTVIANWGKSVVDFHNITHHPLGWQWLAMLNKGDYLNFLGLALLAGLTIVCYMILLPGYFKRKDWTYFTIVVLEILVLSVAASGILGGGGH